MIHDFLSYKVNDCIHEENLGLQVALYNLENAVLWLQSHMGIEIQTLGIYLCTGPYKDTIIL